MWKPNWPTGMWTYNPSLLTKPPLLAISERNARNKYHAKQLLNSENLFFRIQWKHSLTWNFFSSWPWGVIRASPWLSSVKLPNNSTWRTMYDKLTNHDKPMMMLESDFQTNRFHMVSSLLYDMSLFQGAPLVLSGTPNIANRSNSHPN